MNFFRRYPRLIGPILVALSITVTGVGLLAADLYYHNKFHKSAGTNYRGYRGEVLGKKGPNELRIFVLGGSTAFGYGVKHDETISAYLEQAVSARVFTPNGMPKIRVVNLGYNNESAVCFADTLKYYDYLKPDAVIFYSGYNDTPSMTLYRKPEDCFRNKSWMFRTVGYLPILPIVLEEKYYLLRYGSIGEGYRKAQTRNRRPIPPDMKSAIEYGDQVQALDKYLGVINNLTNDLHSRGMGVIYVTQPYLPGRSYHVLQQENIRHLFSMYSGYKHFQYVNLGDIFTQEKLKEYISDGMHLTKEGNEAIAYALLEPTLWMIKTLRPEWNIIF